MILRANTRTRTRRPGQVRYAVVGLGYIAQIAVLPAFQHARKNSVLTAIVSGDVEKREALTAKYEVPRAVSYDGYDDLLQSGEIDAVYIALPNDLHHEYALRAAEAGIHVLCEKPLGLTEDECDDMIAAAARNDVRLMTAYRLHFDPATLRAIEIVQSGKIGEPRFISAEFAMRVDDPDNIRLSQRRGGGPIYDLGIYCINAARSLFQAEPTEVMGWHATSPADERFREVEEMTSAMLRFPGERLATLTCSFGSADISAYHIVGTTGDLRVEPAFEYAEGLAHRLTVDGVTTRRKFPKRDQFAPELIAFSRCVLEHTDPEPSGMEGLADIRVIEAVHESAASRAVVTLAPFKGTRHPSPDQVLRRPPVRKPELVDASGP